MIHMTTILLVLCGFLMCNIVNCISETVDNRLRTLVPHIMGEYFKLTPTENGYRYNEKLPNGATHAGVVEYMNRGTENEEFIVKGVINIIYPDINKRVVTTYVASRNGTRASTRYDPIVAINTQIGTTALKSTVG